MKKYFIFLMLSLYFQNPLWAQEPFEISSQFVLSDSGYYCGLDANGVICWSPGGGSMRPPAKNPRQVSAGDETICTIDDEGVKCFNYSTSIKQSVTNVPPLRNPRQVSATEKFACALDDDGVKCWGDAYFDLSKIPALKNPREISVNGGYICALDDDGVRCWSSFSTAIGVPVALAVSRKAHHLNNGHGGACVIDGGQVKCWEQLSTRSIPTPVLKNPRSVSYGSIWNICAIDDEGVKCWDTSDGEIYWKGIPKFQNPQEVMANTQGGCVLDDRALTCWYYSHSVPYIREIKQWFYPMVSAGRISYWIQELVNFTQPVRTRYLSAIREFEIPSDKIISWYLNLFLLAPAIESADSDYMQTAVIPNYRKTSERINHVLIKNKTPIVDSDLNRQIALKHLQVALNGALDFLSSDEKIQLQDLVRSIGIAFHTPNDANVRVVTGELKAKHAILDALKQSKKTEFLVATIDLASAWLNKWVP